MFKLGIKLFLKGRTAYDSKQYTDFRKIFQLEKMIKNLCWYSIFIFFSCQFLHGQIQEVNWSAALVALYEQSNRLSIGNDGSVLVVGYFQDSLLGVSAGGFEDGLLVKYNAQGQRQWVHSFHSTDVDRIYIVLQLMYREISMCAVNLRGKSVVCRIP